MTVSLNYGLLTKPQTSGVLDIYDRAEVDQYLAQDALGKYSSDSFQRAAISLIFSIGAQSRMSSTTDADIAAAGFNHGRRVAFRENLENPTVDLIRLFLLMSFYMIGACRRHTAVMHIGVACTAAIMLGLHDTEQYAGLQPAERRIRWKTYQALVTTDSVNATLLGRPLMTPSLTLGKPLLHGELIDHSKKDHNIGTAAFEICLAVKSIATQAGQNARVETSEVQHVVEELIQWAAVWKKANPPFDSATGKSLSNGNAHASAVGYLHISCVYYHALILVTRPSLVDTLLDSVLSSPDPSTTNPDRMSDHLSDTCVDAAVHLAQTCYDAYSAGFILDNMSHVLRYFVSLSLFRCSVC